MLTTSGHEYQFAGTPGHHPIGHLQTETSQPAHQYIHFVGVKPGPSIGHNINGFHISRNPIERLFVSHFDQHFAYRLTGA